MTTRQGSAEHEAQHRSVVGDLAAIVDVARASAAQSVNGVMNAAYWLIGRQLVAYEHSITWWEHGATLAARFPLPWSAYVRLLSVKDRSAREFCENQAIHGGWSVRQLDRQIISLLYDRTARSGDATGVLNGGSPSRAEVEVAPSLARATSATGTGLRSRRCIRSATGFTLGLTLTIGSGWSLPSVTRRSTSTMNTVRRQR